MKPLEVCANCHGDVASDASRETIEGYALDPTGRKVRVFAYVCSACWKLPELDKLLGGQGITDPLVVPE